MKTLELLTKIEADGTWYIIRLTIDGKKDSKFFLNKEEANKKFDEAVMNFEMLGKETVLRTASFNDQIKTMYVSGDTGAAFLELPDGGSYYDIRTDATLEVVENIFAKCKGDIKATIERLKENQFFAERIRR